MNSVDVQPVPGATDGAGTSARSATMSIRGLTVFGHHGTVDAERSLGQNFRFDVDVFVGDCAACRSDDLADAVDYAAVVDVVVHVATQFRFQLLEALAEAVCLEILEEFPIQRVRLSVEKPAPALPHPVDAVQVTLERDQNDLRATVDGNHR